MLKLLQLANGSCYVTNKETKAPEVYNFDETKFNWLKAFCAATNDNILICYQFKFDITRLLTLPGAELVKTPEQVAKWMRGEIKVGIISPYSMKFGGNLQSGGHILIWYGLTFNLLNYLQTNKRLWRQGQQYDVECYYIMINKTYDEYVYKVLNTKNKKQQNFLNKILLQIADKTQHIQN